MDIVAVCVKHWADEQQHRKRALTEIPFEILIRGGETIETYLKEVRESSEEDLVLRRKVCIVGSSRAGKTSLVKSITSMSSTLVADDDHTISVDLFHLSFTEEIEDKDSRAGKKYHDVSFWDFAGQDEYHVAHSLFFSRRMLYLLCVDVTAFNNEVEKSRSHKDQDNEDAAEAVIDAFVRERVWRWFRMIFTRQPDAEFVLIATEADGVGNNGEERLQELAVELFGVLDDFKSSFMDEMEKEIEILRKRTSSETDAETQQVSKSRISELEKLLMQLDESLPSSWTPLNVCDQESIQHARTVIERVVVDSGRSFLMPKKYSRVLEAIQELRKEKPNQTTKKRIKQIIVQLPTLRKQLMQSVDELAEKECDTILETLHDLGDVLWYARDGLNVLGETVILSATLLIEFIRQIICHNPSESGKSMDNQLVEELQQHGKVAHRLVESFSLWKRLTPKQMLQFKLLLQHFRLAFPAGATDMTAESDLIVPAYWHVRQNQVDLEALEALSDKITQES
ncbi:hypothetical protein Poli38472_004664 [Pythium oligandrum]|uniref:Uncharacterized protein n=1 Tax=Pythium oligandrum TaxID=41045 RepID=A0A8K1FDN0_PYTOL|nr:hypothetical protein Poli38472_004664 [Pythium oligandrum]|eukprot:TMW59595.1 hypothetical protein Poli38472_004664 [Pythium oligandrum]